MKKSYEQESGFCFDEASDIALRLKVLAGEIYNAQVNMEWIKQQMFINTATGERLDYFASQRGITRRNATKAKGQINFSVKKEAEHSIPVPKGTVVATNDEEPIRFITTEDGYIPMGGTFVIIPAQAETAGSIGNIARQRAVIQVNVPSEVDKVINKQPFKNGADAETDDELRKRIQDSFIHLPNGTNGAYYENLALSVDGISKASAVGKARGTGTVNVYVYDKKSISNEAIADAQKLISKMRELNVDVKVFAANKVPYNLDIIVYKKEEFGTQQVITKCTDAFTHFIENMNIGEKLFLSRLGKVLLDTGCIENYEFNTTMEEVSLSNSQCFSVGSIDIEVI